MRSSSFFLATALATASLCPAQTAPSTHTPVKSVTPTPTKLDTVPEIIFFNGVIYTGNGFAEDKPEIVQAMAIGGGKVLAVGTTEEITRLAGPKTRLRDLNTASTSTFIFPGFNDAHVHLGSAGRTKLNVDLTGVKSLAEMLAKIQSFAKAAPSGHWLTGGNWDHTSGKQNVLPTRRTSTASPAAIPHFSIASTATSPSPTPPHWPLPASPAKPSRRKAEPSISTPAASPPASCASRRRSLVDKVIPPPSHDERRRGDELAIADALAHGVTSVQDFSDWEDFLVYEELEKEGKLNLRITEWLPFNAPLPDLIRMRAHHDINDPMLHTGFLKGFMDGSLGSRTAAMKAPYADDPGNTGLPQYTQDQLNKMAVERAQAGFQLGFHAIGDKATSMALDAFTQAEKPQTRIARLSTRSLPPSRSAV
jgi:predicted amidohydrolase YtcJ